MLTLHKNYQGVAKEPIFFVGENGEAKELKGEKAVVWLNKLKKGSELLVTSAHSVDRQLCEQEKRGIKIYYTNWHKTGIEKDLEPDQIAAKFSMLDRSILYRFVPRVDLIPLRDAVDVRNYQVRVRVAMTNRRGAILRACGVSAKKIKDLQKRTKEDKKATKQLQKLANKLPKYMLEEDEEVSMELATTETAVSEHIAELAQQVEECRIFNRVFGMEAGWRSSAEFVVRVGDISRYLTVSSLWHYCGFHVVNGYAPRRKIGEPSDWNPKVRTVLWKCIDAGLKNNVPTIRNMYQEFLGQELNTHDAKHPGCKHPQGHCGARARRRVTKELLTRYYNEAGGIGRPREKDEKTMAVAAA